MKIIIEVPDAKASEVQDWLKYVPLATNKKKDKLTIQLTAGFGAKNSQAEFAFTAITLELPKQPAFKVGDVVGNTKSGNWGVVTWVGADTGIVVVTASKESRNETNCKEFEMLMEEVELLV